MSTSSTKSTAHYSHIVSVPSCWICFESLPKPETIEERREREGNPIHSCECSLVAHVSCLLRWIGRAEDRRCPQCHSNLLIVPNPSVFSRLLNRAYTGVILLYNFQETAANITWYLARRSIWGGAFLYCFLGPDVFKLYFGDSLAEWVHHSLGFFILSTIYQAFETPVIQDYCRFSLPIMMIGGHYFTKEGLGLRQHWSSFPPSPAVTLFAMPFVKYFWDRFWDSFVRSSDLVTGGEEWAGSAGMTRFMLDIHRVPPRTFVLDSRDDIRIVNGDDDPDLPDWADDDHAFQLPADPRAKTIGTVHSVVVVESLPFVGWVVGQGLTKLAAAGGSSSSGWARWIFAPLRMLMGSRRTYAAVGDVLARAESAGTPIVLPKPGLASLLSPANLFDVLKHVEPVWWHMAIGMATWLVITDYSSLLHMISLRVDQRYRTVMNSARPASYARRVQGRFLNWVQGREYFTPGPAVGLAELEEEDD
ncbi:hypothetical protein DL93DRAFT_1862175 [Clavulina sp. PMI_390]|nr:hypothetical protein DL93DRAFT_1862175 [Clavulina sp. PMI_390]